tara:strand:+ start:20 stop:421 length:402 start_codon:yes stop_codon:yes gene_type:complete
MKKKKTDINEPDDSLDLLEKSFEDLWSSLEVKDKNSFQSQLRGIIRDEMEALLFDIKCDASGEAFNRDPTEPYYRPIDIEEGSETMDQASIRRRKEANARRKNWKSQIEKKKSQRHKCRLNEELERWKVLADI